MCVCNGARLIWVYCVDFRYTEMIMERCIIDEANITTSIYGNKFNALNEEANEWTINDHKHSLCSLYSFRWRFQRSYAIFLGYNGKLFAYSNSCCFATCGAIFGWFFCFVLFRFGVSLWQHQLSWLDLVFFLRKRNISRITLAKYSPDALRFN